MNPKASFKGRYRVKEIEKYIGDPTNVIFRSTWERKAFAYLDKSSSVKKWCSESVIIAYISPIDNKQHKYYIDLYIEFDDGRILLVEIKPQKQTVKPKKGKNPSTYQKQMITYQVNLAKWQYAKNYAKQKGFEFQIWSETVLKNLGIKL